ncbi:uncharacterized protein F5147DRAFT_670877 [Suillus discolor]|uniref:Uncharacterized protein n=1 Tax=Suillus discolor TaxID=1912936 RepID=A0A9P7FFI1_9AGAM|nr:uncharacterized protein F5147DRAFT_670877 [Suillus discolor]KAG2117055.1 hypothetical protein F5147DRAFT_670877 [Suillus discolor]
MSELKVLQGSGSGTTTPKESPVLPLLILFQGVWSLHVLPFIHTLLGKGSTVPSAVSQAPLIGEDLTGSRP